MAHISLTYLEVEGQIFSIASSRFYVLFCNSLIAHSAYYWHQDRSTAVKININNNIFNKDPDLLDIRDYVNKYITSKISEVIIIIDSVGLSYQTIATIMEVSYDIVKNIDLSIILIEQSNNNIEYTDNELIEVEKDNLMNCAEWLTSHGVKKNSSYDFRSG